MRDAKHIQKLCTPLTPVDMDWAITEGCAREINAQKSTQPAGNAPQTHASSSNLQMTRGSCRRGSRMLAD